MVLLVVVGVRLLGVNVISGMWNWPELNWVMLEVKIKCHSNKMWLAFSSLCTKNEDF